VSTGFETAAKQRLVIITGPVGGGKSTVAIELAAQMKAAGCRVAVIDLDVVYGMVRQKGGFGELEVWAVARRMSSALATSVFAEGYDCVILEGEFFSREHFEPVRMGLPRPTVFVLNASYEKALHRVGLDASRGASKDPVLLRQFHDAFLEALPFLTQGPEIVDAEHQPAFQIAEHMAARLKACEG
jgi:shikimate kinase